jgi:hypothetical protein
MMQWMRLRDNRTPRIIPGVVTSIMFVGCPCALNPPITYTESPTATALTSVLR